MPDQEIPQDVLDAIALASQSKREALNARTDYQNAKANTQSVNQQAQQMQQDVAQQTQKMLSDSAKQTQDMKDQAASAESRAATKVSDLSAKALEDYDAAMQRMQDYLKLPPEQLQAFRQAWEGENAEGSQDETAEEEA